MNNYNKFIDDILNVIGPGDNIQLHEPYFDSSAWEYQKQCLDTGWVSSGGNFVIEFEELLKKTLDVKFAIATVNGTSALHALYLAAGILPEDEVLCPTLTFVATANAIKYCGAEPNFIDCNLTDLSIHTEKLEAYLQEIGSYSPEKGLINKKTKRRISAIVVSHILGHIGNLRAAQKIAQQYNLILIEDAAQALGSTYYGYKTGHYSSGAALSFNGNKIITTGGGGAIVTNDEKIATIAKHITTTSRVQHAWKVEHDRLGYNYRMPNINAALGVSQLSSFPKYLKSKRALAQAYKKTLSNNTIADFIDELANCSSNFWLNAVFLKNSVDFEPLMSCLHRNGIYCRGLWNPLHALSMYKKNPSMQIEFANDAYSKTICLPSSISLGFKYAD